MHTRGSRGAGGPRGRGAVAWSRACNTNRGTCNLRCELSETTRRGHSLYAPRSGSKTALSCPRTGVCPTETMGSRPIPARVNRKLCGMLCRIATCCAGNFANTSTTWCARIFATWYSCVATWCHPSQSQTVPHTANQVSPREIHVQRGNRSAVCCNANRVCSTAYALWAHGTGCLFARAAHGPRSEFRRACVRARVRATQRRSSGVWVGGRAGAHVDLQRVRVPMAVLGHGHTSEVEPLVPHRVGPLRQTAAAAAAQERRRRHRVPRRHDRPTWAPPTRL